MFNLHGGGIGLYRSWIPAEALKRKGHKVEYQKDYQTYFDYLAKNNKNIHQWFEDVAWKNDIIHLNYTTLLSQTQFAVALRNYAHITHNHNIHLITDLDDDIHNVPKYNLAYKSYLPGSSEKKNLLIQLRVSDGVSVTNNRLKEVIKDDAKNITILPNYCNPNDWPNISNTKRKEDKSIRLMFTGGPAHYNDLKEVEEAIEYVMKYYDGTKGKPYVRLFFLGCTPDYVKKYMQSKLDPFLNRCFYLRPGSVTAYWNMLSYVEPDILFSPIESNVFNKSKSCIKAYDSVISKSSFICSDYDTYNEVPSNTCLKASTSYQWKESLGELIENPSLRDKLKKNMKEWVLTERQIDDHIYKWEDYYTSIKTKPIITSIDDMVKPPIMR